MLLKSVRINNFRLFYGISNINFSSSKDKKVTVIIGENSFGKTTFLQTLIWGLYGFANFKQNEEIINLRLIDEINDGDEAEVSVSINLEHLGFEFEFERKTIYIKNFDKMKILRESFIGYMKDENGVREKLEDPADYVEQILPRDLVNCFFFDNERIKNIADKSEIEDAIKVLLNIKPVIEALKHLGKTTQSQTVIGSLFNSIDRSANKEIKDFTENIEKLQLDLFDNNTTIDDLKKANIDLEKNIKDIETILINNKASAKMQKEVNSIENELDKEKMCLEKNIERIKKKFSNCAKFFKYYVKEKTETLFDSKDESLITLRDITSYTIDDIIKRGKCLCGNEIKEDNVAYINLKREQELLPPNSLGLMVKDFLSNFKNLDNDYSDEIKESYKSYLRTSNKIHEYENKIIELNKNIFNIDNLSELEKHKEEYNELLVENNTDINIKEKENENIENQIKDTQKKLTEAMSKTEKNNFLSKYLDYAQFASNYLSNYLDTINDQIRKDLQENVNNTLSKIYHGKRVVEIDKDYKIILKTNEGREPGESEGTKTIRNFAFIFGIVELAKTKCLKVSGVDLSEDLRSEPYPLVMDAPFTSLDEKHIINVSREVLSNSDQIIVIMVKKDYDIAKEYIQNVGRKYEIIKESEVYSYIKETKNV